MVTWRSGAAAARRWRPPRAAEVSRGGSRRPRRRLPLLAVCRWKQVVNVALGGTLVQDMNETVQTTAAGCTRPR